VVYEVSYKTKKVSLVNLWSSRYGESEKKIFQTSFGSNKLQVNVKAVDAEKLESCESIFVQAVKPNQSRKK
jgi:hypothetical protein